MLDLILNEAKRSSSSALLRSLVDALPTPILFLDSDYKALDFNEAFCRLVGVQMHELDGRSICELVPESLKAACRSAKSTLGEASSSQHECDIQLGDTDYRAVFKRATLGPMPEPIETIIVSLMDTTAYRKLRGELERHKTANRRGQTHHDPLTGLFNRQTTQEILAKMLETAVRTRRPLSVLLFDLDRFKLINDNFGNAIGDAVLTAAADTSVEALRKSDWIGRWGGEEFLCVLPHTDTDAAAHIAEHLRRKVEEMQINLDGHELKTTVSVGIASFPKDGETMDMLLAAADSALFEAKRNGRNRIALTQREIPQIFAVAGELETAIKQGRLQAAYQPIVDLQTGRVVADEALARIRQLDGSFVVANHFVEAANHLQLSHKIDHMIAVNSIRRCSALLGNGEYGVTHFINTSADLLRHPDLVEDILRVAREACAQCFTGADPNCSKPIVIEITEREFLGNVQDAREILAPLIDFGLRIAIDDFGSGYSSFEYLVDLPVSFLKIEGSLVQRARNDPRARAILRGIRDIAKELDLVTIAEFIEDEATAAMLREIGIDWGQGYYFGRPVAD